jgi:hypothetical protein
VAGLVSCRDAATPPDADLPALAFHPSNLACKDLSAPFDPMAARDRPRDQLPNHAKQLETGVAGLVGASLEAHADLPLLSLRGGCRHC